MKKWSPDFKSKHNNTEETYYDLYSDYSLIEASFLEQYKIRLREVDDLSWDEFCTYLAGLNEKTALGKIVAIRSEKDPKIIKEMTAEQKRIRKEWEKRSSEKYSEEEIEKIMLAMSAGFTKAFQKK